MQAWSSLLNCESLHTHIIHSRTSHKHTKHDMKFANPQYDQNELKKGLEMYFVLKLRNKLV